MGASNCDESPNSCGSCIKRGVRCSLKPPSPPPQTTISSPISTFSLLDLELLHNFSTETSLSMSSYAALCKFYQTGLITEALKSDYLLHAILGFSAFHLKQQHQDILESTNEEQRLSISTKIEAYLVAGRAHCSAAIPPFREHLVNITPENCHSLYACASIIFAISFIESHDNLASFNAVEGTANENQGPGQIVTKWLLLLRGIRTVASQSWAWVEAGPMAQMADRSRYKGYEHNIAQVDEDITTFLNQLSAAFSQYSEFEVSTICIAAIDLLRKSFAGVASGCDAGVVFFWPALVDADFITLLESDRPEALLVLASYAVLLHTQSWRWWIRDLPQSIHKAIEGKLDGRWMEWLSWPAQAIRDTDAGQLQQDVLLVTEGTCCR
ncbi:hypothetical protein B7494_g6818 [Chlorociboria aeruginascens]|nr:hypothetical protein B7494_g6818 [Chlorociboria aeruginascens]